MACKNANTSLCKYCNLNSPVVLVSNFTIKANLIANTGSPIVGASESNRESAATSTDNEFDFAFVVTTCTCGKEMKGGVETGSRSCCGEGGSWFKQCKKYNQGETRTADFPHSWQEGKEACPGKITLNFVFTSHVTRVIMSSC